MATPTYDDLQKELDLALEYFDKKEISYSEFLFVRKELFQKMKELTPPPKEKTFDEFALERMDSPAVPIDYGTAEVPSIQEIMIDVPIKSDAPSIFPYEPKSDLPQVQKDYFQNRYSYYFLQQGEDRNTARESALKDLQQVFSVPTADYSTERGFESNIVDVEKGLVRDRETGQVRKADTGELFLEAFKRQRIGELPVVKEEREREIERALSLLQQQVPPEEIDLGDLPGPEEKDEYVSKRVEKVITEPAKKLAGAVLTEEVPETGEIYESTLGAALRDIGLTFSGAAAATGQEGLSLFVAPNESDMYRLADSGDWVDQFITNVAKGQGIPELYAANPYGPASYVGNRVEGWTPESVAWWMGMGMELPLPLTGIPLAVKTASKTARLTGRGLQKTGVRGLKETGAVLEGMSNPAQAARYYTTKSQIDQMFDKIGMGKTTKEVVDDYYAGKFTWDDWVDAQAKQANLQDISADLIAERYATLASMQTLIRAGEDITVADYLLRASHKGQPPPTALAVLKQAGIDIKQNPKTGRLEVAKEIKLTDPRIKGVLKDSQYELKGAGYRALQSPSKDRSLLVLNNKMEAMEDFSVEGIKATLKETTKRLSTEGIDDFVDELRRTSAAYNLSRNVDIFDQLKTKDGSVVVGGELEKLLEDVSKSFDDTDFIFVVNEAMRNTLKGTIKETLLNKAPRDLTLLAGSLVIPTRVYKNKGLRKKFDDAVAKEREKINYSARENVYLVGENDVNDIIDMFIDYAGVNTIRQSKKMKDFLMDLHQKGQFSPRQYQEFVEPSIMNRAGKDMGAFRLQTGGRQAELAAVPQEFRGDVLAISAGQDISTQFSKGQLGQFFRAVKQIFKDEPSVHVDMKNALDPSPEFAATGKRINAKIDKVQENFEKEYVAASKRSDPITAMDAEMRMASELSVSEKKRRIEATVNRVYKNDWETYAREMDPDYYDQMARRVDETGQSWEDAVLDFQLYFELSDDWDKILSGYFGSRYLDYYGVKEKRLTHKKYIAKGDPEGATAAEQSAMFEPRVSNFLPINFSNMRRVIERVKADNPDLLTPLTKPKWIGKGEEMPLLVAQEWILGMKQAKVVREELLSFIDKNPQFRVELIPDYLASNMQVNLAPLANQYQTILFRALDEGVEKLDDILVADPLTGGTINIKKFLIDKAKQTIVDDDIIKNLADTHFKLLTATGIKERSKLINIISSKMVQDKTLIPDLSELRGELFKVIKIPTEILNAEINKVFSLIKKSFGKEGKVLDDTDWQNLVRETTREMEDLLMHGMPIDGRYHADVGLGVISEAVRSLREYFLANGIAVGDEIMKGLDQAQPLLQKIEGSDVQFLFGPQYKNDAKKLLEMANSKKLRTTVEDMRKVSEAGGGTALLYFLGRQWEFFRRTMSQGLLAGIGAPNIPYLAQNVVTAPLIMMGTLGSRSLKVFPHIKSSLSIGKMAPNTPVFRSRSGRIWTAQELRNLENNYNLGLSRQQVELYESSAAETMAKVGYSLKGEPLSTGQRFGNFVNPAQRGMWSHLADNTDYMYRRAAFYSALADDMPVEQAVDIAKRSLLDYGSMSQVERNTAQKYVLFWSFTRQMHSELINAIYKGITTDAGHNYIWKAMRASARQQKDTGSWLYADDKSKARLYSMWADKIDGKDLWTFGYSNPYVETFETFSNIASLAHPDTSADQVWEAARKGLQLRPVLNFILEQQSDRLSERVPSSDILLMQTLGLWKYGKKHFEIIPVKDYTTSPRTQDERRAAEPVYGAAQQQYRMSQKGARRYSFWKLAFLMLGASRTPRDYAKLYMAAVGEDADADYKRFGTPNLFLKAAGAETSIPTKGEREIIQQHEKKIERELMKLMKDME